MSHGEVIVVEEADRQFEFIQALKKLDFYATRNLLHLNNEDEDDDGDEAAASMVAANIENQRQSVFERDESRSIYDDRTEFDIDEERDEIDNESKKSKLTCKYFPEPD